MAGGSGVFLISVVSWFMAGDAIAFRAIGLDVEFETPNPVGATDSLGRVGRADKAGREVSFGSSGDTVAAGSGDVAGDSGETKVSMMGVLMSSF